MQNIIDIFKQELYQLLSEATESKLQLDNNPSIAIAVSGGADSMCLTYLTQQLIKVDITCLIVDHGLRLESSAEAERTAEFLRSKNLPCIILKWLQYDELRTISNLHHQARYARYNLLSQYCHKNKINCLLVGHNKNDQAETVLMNIARGSGIDGLTGISRITHWDGISILRPLLKLSRSMIESTLKQIGWPWICDPSNTIERFTRSKIRRLLALSETQAVLSEERLILLANNATRCRAFLEYSVQQAYSEVCTPNILGYVILDRNKFSMLHEEIRLRLLQLILKKISGGERLHAYWTRLRSISQLCDRMLLIEKKLWSNCTLGGCEIMLLQSGNFLFFREAIQIKVMFLQAGYKTHHFIWDNRLKITITSDLLERDKWSIYPLNKKFLGKFKYKSYISLPTYKIALTTPTLFLNEQIICNMLLDNSSNKTEQLGVKMYCHVESLLTYTSKQFNIYL